MLKTLSFIVIFMCAFGSAKCNEIEDESQILLRLAALATILEDQDTPLLDSSQQRLYVDPEKIAISKQGSIVYATNDKTVVLPELFSNCSGCFVNCSEKDLQTLSRADELRAWWCPKCRRIRNMDQWGRCTKCGTKL